MASIYVSPAVTVSGCSKLPATPPGGTVDCMPVMPSDEAFQLQRTGARELLLIAAHDDEVTFHISQSKNPEPGPLNVQASNPEVLM